MNQRMSPNAVSRRNFLKTAAGLSFVFAIAPDALAPGDEALADTARPDGPYAPNVWLTIAPDGAITVVSPAAEMGQGSFTTLPLIIAEELDADWSKVRPIFPTDWDGRKFGNPAYDYAFQTSASASVHGYFTPLRLAGAQARRVMLDAVAVKWSVPVTELSTEPSVVVHKLLCLRRFQRNYRRSTRAI
jgi:isoquinoline 1-oxidoreductase beta subunit